MVHRHETGAGERILVDLGRRHRLQRERVDALGQFGGEQAVNKPLAIDARLAGELLRNDRDPEMRLAARIMAGVTGVLVALVDDLERDGGQGLGQFGANAVCVMHGYMPMAAVGHS